MAYSSRVVNFTATGASATEVDLGIKNAEQVVMVATTSVTAGGATSFLLSFVHSGLAIGWTGPASVSMFDSALDFTTTPSAFMVGGGGGASDAIGNQPILPAGTKLKVEPSGGTPSGSSSATGFVVLASPV